MATVAIQVGLLAASVLLQAILAPKQKAQRLDDTRVPRATAGSPLFYTWGTTRIDSIRIWSTPLTEEIVDTGGKNLFAGRQEQAIYYASFADMFCRGTIVAYLRLWFNNKIKYDVRSGLPGEVISNSIEFAQDYLRFHLGTASQTSDSLLESIDGAANTYPYRHRAYISVEGLPVDEFGNSAPTLSAEISANGVAVSTPPMVKVGLLEYVTWTSLSGQVTADISLEKNPGATFGFNAGAISSQLIEGAGGRLIFSIKDGRAAVGLSNTNPDGAQTSIDYCIVASTQSGVQVTENGVLRAAVTYQDGELRIEATDTGIKYYNGGSLIYSSTIAPTYPLFVDASIDTPGASILARVTTVELVPTGGLTQIQGRDESLSNIVRDLCTRVGGLLESQVDVSELNGISVPGFTHGDKSARDSIQVLAQAFFFEAIETESGIRFQLMKRPSVSANIPVEDLGAHEGGSDVDYLIKTSIDDGLDLPKIVRVRYRNPAIDYDQDESEYVNASATTAVAQSYDLPIVLQRSTGDLIARRLCFLPYIQRFKFEFNLPIKYLYLEPGDVITIPGVGNTTRQVKIESIRNTGSFLLSVSARAYDGAIFDGVVTPEYPLPANYRSTLTPIVDTRSHVLDVPLVRATDTDIGMYAVANGASGWLYATLYGSRDGGNSYQEVVVMNGSPFGRCLVKLNSAQYGYIDYRSTLLVEMEYGSISTTSFPNIFSGSNLAFVGNNDAGWELIAYQNAVLQSTPRQYLLSVLRRGLSGTEGQIGSHSATDFFVPIPAGSRRFLLSQEDLNQIGYFRAVSKGQSLDRASPFGVTYRGRDIKPFAPASLRVIQLSNGDLRITWHRRDRRSSRRITWVGVALSDPNRFLLQIFNGSTIARSVVVEGSEAYVYSTADQISDFGSQQDSVVFNVAQAANHGGWGYFAGSG